MPRIRNSFTKMFKKKTWVVAGQLIAPSPDNARYLSKSDDSSPSASSTPYDLTLFKTKKKKQIRQSHCKTFQKSLPGLICELWDKCEGSKHEKLKNKFGYFLNGPRIYRTTSKSIPNLPLNIPRRHNPGICQFAEWKKYDTVLFWCGGFEGPAKVETNDYYNGA